MSMDSFAIGTVTWLVTFAVHSTVLLGSAWLLASRLGRGAHRDEERWWKIAMLAGILTTSGQTALGIRPFTGELSLPAVTMEVDTAPVKKPILETFGPATLLRRTVDRGVARPQAARVTRVQPAPAEAKPDAHTAQAWVMRVVGFWILCASLGLIALTLSWTRLSRMLRHRTQLSGLDGGARGTLYQLFEELSRKADLTGKVCLSASNRLDSPITFGIFRREVCLPHAAVYSLDRDEQRAMLAHELAHAKRHDPAWVLAVNVLERVLFFQPLLRVARKKQQHLAEYLCDDWAVTQTKDPVSLASCLTEVASWVVGRQQNQLVPSMAAAGFELETRVHRILSAKNASPLSRLRYALLPLAAASCFGVLFGIPSVSATPSPEPPNIIREFAAVPATPEVALEPMSATSKAPRISTTAAPKALLASLDQELNLLNEALDALRVQAAELGAGERIIETLQRVELSLQSLESRRQRLETLLPTLSKTGSFPAASQR